MKISPNDNHKNLLESLINILSLNGAFFDKHIIIHSNNSELSIHTNKQQLNQKKLIDIPMKLMPVVNDYKFTLFDNILICIPKKGTDSIQAKIMNLMIDIYNKNHKIKYHKDSNIFYNLNNHREFLNLILYPIKNRKTDDYIYFIENKQFDELIIETFLYSRIYSNKNPINQSQKNVIIPIIDYLNHKITTRGYQINKEKESVYIESYPTNEISDELFVCYNYYDSLDTLIYYGFTDITSPLLFSIPMEITLSNDIIIKIERTSFRILSKEDVSEGLKNIKDFIPKIEKNSDNEIVISKLAIPGTNLKLLLRKVLHLILNEIKVDFSDDIRSPIIKSIEESIIVENINYYEELKVMAQVVYQDIEVSSFIKEQLKLLINHNIDFLNLYKKNAQYNFKSDIN